MVLMTIGEFSKRTRLSAKALRLYDGLGLVVPIDVDPTNGYRYYEERQVPDAVLIAMLRRLDMPLEEIASVLRAVEPDRAQFVRSYWGGVEKVSAERRELVEYVLSRMEGTTMEDHHIEIRMMPERRVASMNRHVLARETDAFFNEAFAALQSTGPGLDGIAGCPFVVYYGEVSDDSDGPVELCRPIAGTDPVVAQGIETRIEAPHDEVYVRLRKSELAWPVMRGVLDEIESWARSNSREPASTFRQVLIADQRRAAVDALVCDLTVPLK
jgi:DNA-binding transcriptional MerR regulator